MEQLKSPQPQLVDEVEALLGVPFFFDDIDELEISLDAENLGLRRHLYQSALRLIAEARHEERAKIKNRANYSAERWNNNWELTPKKLGEIALKETEKTDFMARQLSLANGAETYLRDNWDELNERLRDDQLEYILDIPHAIHKEPKTITTQRADGTAEQHELRATAIIAPTGFGKTRIMESCIKMFQPGKPPQFVRSRDNTRVLVIEPSVALVDQTSKELEEALPDIRVGRVRQDVCQPGADVVVVTIDMFNEFFKDGMLLNWNVDAVVADEGHHVFEPELYKTLTKEWRGHTMLVTATPAYDATRDIRNISTRTIEKRTIDESIEEGVLNDAEIYTFIVNSEVYKRILEEYELPNPDTIDRMSVRDAIDYLLIDFLRPYLEEGRRGIIFCEQGNDAYYARQLAAKLRDTKLTDGRYVAADAMYSAANNQEAAIKKFHEGNSQVLVTVDTGREGLNAAFDFVVVNCNLISELRGRQIAGRGTRRSEKFPSTVYGQFHIGDILDSRMLETSFSLEQAFGGTHLSQGRQKKEQYKNDEDELHKTENDQTAVGDEQEPLKKEQSKTFNDSKFSVIVQDLLEQVENRPIGEVFTGVERGLRKIHEDSISLDEIIEGYDTTEHRAKKLLRRAGFRWQGRYDTVDGARKLIHYYSEEAKDHLHSILPKEPEMLSEQQAADKLGVPIAVVKRVADNETNSVAGERVVRPKGRPVRCFSKDAYAEMKRIIEEMPGKSSGSKPVKEVAEQLNIDETTVWKLAGASSDDGRYPFQGSYWLSATEIARAEEVYDSVPYVKDGEKNLTDISRSTGVERNVISRQITPEERNAAENRRYRDPRGWLQEGPHWSAEHVAAIEARVEKFRPRKLAAHYVTVSALNKLVATVKVLSKEEWEGKLEEGGHSVTEMRILGLRALNRCVSWGGIQHLTEVYGRFKGAGAISIDFDRLPLDENDRDPDKILYAQKIQSRLLENAELEEYTFGE